MKNKARNERTSRTKSRNKAMWSRDHKPITRMNGFAISSAIVFLKSKGGYAEEVKDRKPG